MQNSRQLERKVPRDLGGLHDKVSEELHSVVIPLSSLMLSLKTGVEAPKVIH